MGHAARSQSSSWSQLSQDRATRHGAVWLPHTEVNEECVALRHTKMR